MRRVNLMKLKEIRKKIDTVDSRIIKLIALRFKYSQSTKIAKLNEGWHILDKSRESEVLKNVKNLAVKTNINRDLIKKIYIEILKDSKNKQME